MFSGIYLQCGKKFLKKYYEFRKKKKKVEKRFQDTVNCNIFMYFKKDALKMVFMYRMCFNV